MPEPLPDVVLSHRMRTIRRVGYATTVAEPWRPAKPLRALASVPNRMGADSGPGAEHTLQSADGLATADGAPFVTDTDGGLNILAYQG